MFNLFSAISKFSNNAFEQGNLVLWHYINALLLLLLYLNVYFTMFIIFLLVICTH